MKTGFIGAGKAGCSLGKYFSENEIPLSGYYSLTQESAAWAAEFTNSIHFKELEEIIVASDILFITTPDGVIADIWNEIKLMKTIENKILCHCSGYLSSDVFSKIEQLGSYGCSVHPISAMNSKEEGYIKLADAFFTIEGKEYPVSVVKKLLEKTGNMTKVISAENKAKYHAAASISSNSVLALLQMSVDLLKECGFTEKESLEAILPLALGNVSNVRKKGIQGSLTGPVERFDTATVKGHIECMSGDDRLLYTLLGKKLLKIAEEKHPEKKVESTVLQNILNLKENER